jgi:hypothetical protein
MDAALAAGLIEIQLSDEFQTLQGVLLCAENPQAEACATHHHEFP